MRVKAEVSAESVRHAAKDAEPRGCPGTPEFESDEASSEAQGGAKRKAVSHPSPSQGCCGQIPKHLKALVVLLYLTGLRIGEALALKWSDVDCEQSKLYVRRSVWRRKEQTRKGRKSVRAKHLLEGLARVLHPSAAVKQRFLTRPRK